MPQTFYSKLSLRVKATAITLAITTLALALVAGVSVFQIRSQIEAEQKRSVDSLALGVARASELAMTVRDIKELARITSSFLRDQDVQFIAAYGDKPQPLAVAVGDQSAWDAYQSGKLDPQKFIVAEHDVNVLAQKDEFSAGGESDLGNSNPTETARPSHGRIVVGFSTEALRAAQREQSVFTLAITFTTAAFGGIALFLIISSWTRRMQRLDIASQAIARGDFGNAIGDRGEDEIGRLATSYEAMRIALLERDQKLRGFTDNLQELVQTRTHDLEIALTAAEQASKTKSLFLANMSHELRTPLNGVIGMVDLLLTTPTSPEQRRYCTLAKSSARSLLDLISDILDFSKIEAGKLELDSADFDFHSIVEEGTQVFSERAGKKNIELICSVGRDVPRCVTGDPTRLRQVITNLVGNALKFTQRGEIVVQAAVLEHDAASALVKVEVRDTGVGIPRDRLNRLFQSFSQVDGSTTRKFGGTGLGLAISHRIVELMGGQIGVESEPGKGSTFWFTARLRTREPQAEKLLARVDPRGMRVLAVDDNATNREILHAQLSNWSLRTDIAASATEAMHRLHQAVAEKDPYRVAILDMHMPDTSGDQLAKKIKADPSLRDVILIGLSSIGDAMLQNQLAEIGLTTCLSKPVLPSSLYDAIVDALAAGKPCDCAHPIHEGIAQISPALLAGVRILLAEDHEINRLVASELLAQVGCRVSVAVNGRQAVDAALKETFDVILMDCQMPEIDGFEATRLIRDAEKSSAIAIHRPIIALTANAIKGDEEICRAAGMDGYVTKPIEPRELFDAIRKFASPRRDIETPATNAAAPQAGCDADASAPIDMQSLERRCLGNRNLASKAMDMFSASIGGFLQELGQQIESGDARSAAAMAHKIKGAAGNVSALAVQQLAQELEKLSKSNALDQAQSAMEKLRAEVQRVQEFVNSSSKDAGQPRASATDESQKTST
jgi:signal transduction histidine kinase/CheY-like chemotaxis protein